MMLLLFPSSILGKAELNSFVKLTYATKVEIVEDLLHIRKKIDYKHTGTWNRYIVV